MFKYNFLSNMTTLQRHVRDLIFFYIKTNYEKYLEDNGIKFISDDKLGFVINSLYTDRKDHIQIFIQSSLHKLLKEEHPGDIIITNILRDIFEDDDLCKTRIVTEIQTYQRGKK